MCWQHSHDYDCTAEGTDGALYIPTHTHTDTHTYSIAHTLANNLPASFSSEAPFTHKYINKLRQQASTQKCTAVFLPGREQMQRLDHFSDQGKLPYLCCQCNCKPAVIGKTFVACVELKAVC